MVVINNNKYLLPFKKMFLLWLCSYMKLFILPFKENMMWKYFNWRYNIEGFIKNS